MAAQRWNGENDEDRPCLSVWRGGDGELNNQPEAAFPCIHRNATVGRGLGLRRSYGVPSSRESHRGPNGPFSLAQHKSVFRFKQ